MKRRGIPFTTLLIAVVLANFATLVVTYLLRVPVGWTVPIYLLCAVVGWLLARRVLWRRRAIKIDRVCVVLAVLTLIPHPSAAYLCVGVDTGQYGGHHRRRLQSPLRAHLDDEVRCLSAAAFVQRQLSLESYRPRRSLSLCRAEATHSLHDVERRAVGGLLLLPRVDSGQSGGTLRTCLMRNALPRGF